VGYFVYEAGRGSKYISVVQIRDVDSPVHTSHIPL